MDTIEISEMVVEQSESEHVCSQCGTSDSEDELTEIAGQLYCSMCL